MRSASPRQPGDRRVMVAVGTERHDVVEVAVMGHMHQTRHLGPTERPEPKMICAEPRVEANTRVITAMLQRFAS